MLNHLSRVILVNARSIINKMDELESYVCAHKPDLIMITESWAREDISDAELSIYDFVIFRNDKDICRRWLHLVYYKLLQCNSCRGINKCSRF